jgi:type IV secretory pathway VirB10-like protein
MPPEILYIAIGLVSIISIMLIAFVASNRNQKPEPRLILRKSQPAEIETARPRTPAEMVFETGPKIPVNTDSKPKKGPAPGAQPKNSAARANTTRQSQKGPAGESKFKKQETRPKPAIPKTPKASAAAKAPKKPKAANNSPAIITNDAGLRSNLFKKVTINSIQLLISPDTCEPCQIPGKLKDGTRILLTSPNIQPWRAVQKKGAFNVKAHGFLTKNSQGTYSLIVQKLEP